MKQTKRAGRIRQGLNDTLYTWKREFNTVFHDAGVLIFFIVVPLFYPLVYSFIYTNEMVHDVPTAVLDEARTAQSREYLNHVDATPDVRIVAYCNDMEEAKLMLKEHKAYGIIQIPKDFSLKLARGEQTKVGLFCDMSGLLYYKCLLIANTNVSLAMNKDIKIEKVGNTTHRQDEITTAPLEYDDVSLYNPTNGFAAFLIPAVLILIIQQTLLLGVGLSAGTAREHNRYRELVSVSRRKGGLFHIVFGKSLCYLMVYALMATYMLCIVPRMFRLNQLALPMDLTLFVLPYLLACIFFAITLSVFIRNRETCMLIFVFTSLPLLFISGISWPGASIPDFWRIISYIFPSTFGINGFVRINNMGATLNEVEFEYIGLWIQTAIYFLTACMSYKWQIIGSRKRMISAYQESKRRGDRPT
ncbi:MAG: ABC transporter permease [Bacteroidaceae bacterium]